MDSVNSISEAASLRLRDLNAVLATGVREDGRKLDEYRNIDIKTNLYEKADGSAMVRIGNTVAVAGIKIARGAPFPDTPNDGVLTVSLELLPHASPDFEPGPPDEGAIEMSRVVDRGLRESKSIKYNELCIIPGKSVWIIYVDVYALDHDGNLQDAAGLAALAAVLTAKLPEVKIEGDTVTELETKRPIPIVETPVPVTVAKVGDHLLVDPSAAEEEVSSVRVTMTTIESGVVASIQKSGSDSITMEEALKIYDLAFARAKEIRGKLTAALGVSPA